MILVNGTPVTWGHPEQDGIFHSFEPKPVINFEISEVHNAVQLTYDPAFQQELGEIYFISMLLKDKAPRGTQTLVLDYIPNARMDKRLGEDFDHGIEMAPLNEYTARYFNSMGWGEIIGIEPHSDQFLKHYKNAKAIYPTMEARDHVVRDIRRNYRLEDDPVTWVFPDHGSWSRYRKFFSSSDDCIIMQKTRKNGQIESLSIGEDQKVNPGNIFIIVDDICSRGSTAYNTAKVLKEHGAENFFLLVAYLESSVLGGPLLKSALFNAIYVARRCIGQEVIHPAVHIITTPTVIT